MRFIIYGVGAIGGGVAAALSHAGISVIGIARGRQLEAIQSGGLRLRAQNHDFTCKFPCFAHPREIEFQASDIIVLTMKTQDSWLALCALHECGVMNQPIFCMQNGVANERMALRLFPNVHAVTVMMPAQFLKPGEITVHVAPKFGIFDVGRVPSGHDKDDLRFAHALEEANFAVFPNPDVMRSKYGKLRMNLGNIVQAALGTRVTAPDLSDVLRAEFDQVAKAAGIDWIDVDDDPRRSVHIQRATVPGIERSGGSTTQSLARGTGSLETDYLNGEVSLLGRLNGIDTPVNNRAMLVAKHLLRIGAKPGCFDVEGLRRVLLDGADLPT